MNAWPADADIDEVAVERFMRGERLRLNKDERLAVIIKCLKRDMLWEDIDGLFDRRRGTSQRYLNRVNEKAREQGHPPVFSRQASERALSPGQVVDVRWRAALGDKETTLAAEHGITRQGMRRLLAGITYQDCGGPLLPEPLPRGKREWLLPENPCWYTHWNSTAGWRAAA